MRGRRGLFSDRLLPFLGIFIHICFFTLLFWMFHKPTVSHEDGVKQETCILEESQGKEWAPIENYADIFPTGVLFTDITLNNYRLVVNIMLTKCSFPHVESLLESLATADYSQHQISVDVEIDLQCPPPVSPEQLQEREKVISLIRILRWTRGRMNSRESAFQEKTNEAPTTLSDPTPNLRYIVENWLPTSNWEIGLFIQEGQLLSRHWYSQLQEGIKRYALSDQPQIVKKNPLPERAGRLNFTIENQVPSHLLGFTFGHKEMKIRQINDIGFDRLLTGKSRIGAFPFSYAVQDVSPGLVLFSSQWKRLKIQLNRLRQLLTEKAKDESASSPISVSPTKLVKEAMRAESFYFIYIEERSSPILKTVDVKYEKWEEMSSSSRFPPLQTIPFLDCNTNKFDFNPHIFQDP